MGRRRAEAAQIDPLVAAWQTGDMAAMLAGTPLAGDERALDLLKDLRHGGLYQRMDEVGRQRLGGRHGADAPGAGEAARRR